MKKKRRYIQLLEPIMSLLRFLSFHGYYRSWSQLPFHFRHLYTSVLHRNRHERVRNVRRRTKRYPPMRSPVPENKPNRQTQPSSESETDIPHKRLQEPTRDNGLSKGHRRLGSLQKRNTLVFSWRLTSRRSAYPPIHQCLGYVGDVQ